MPSLNPYQKGFVVRVATLVALVLVSIVLAMLANRGVAGMETNSATKSFSILILNLIGAIMLVVEPWIAIATLLYGRRHEAEIREHSGLSVLLTLYRILFWFQVAVLLLAALFFGGVLVLLTHPVG